MVISTKEVIKLRKETQAPLMACKQALEEAGGDFRKALQILKEKSQMWAEGKRDKEVPEGIIECYLHSNNKLGVMLELSCQTDFVAKNQEFKNLAHDLALQIAATNPKYIGIEEAPQGAREEDCLLSQPFIKNPNLRISELIDQQIAKFGENIRIKRFIRYEVSR